MRNGNQRTGAVIALGEYRKMRHDPLIQQVIAYWEALRGGRPAPLRAEVDPRGIEAALDRVFLAERLAEGIGRFRLSGMTLNDLMGMEVRGMPLTTMILPEGRERFSRALERVFQGGVRTTIRLTAAKGLGRPELVGELLLLPLANDRGDNPLVLGCLVTAGTIGRAPRRMTLGAVHEVAYEATSPAGPRPAPAKAPALPDRLRSKGFAEAEMPRYIADPAPAPATGRSEAPTATPDGRSTGTPGGATNGVRQGGATPQTRRPALRLVKSDL
ncbi:PAS domain-containing protein [Acidimangrovimonas sediminis]|uniref:PAS domain-containing protein n=1 Tax=Acidimangrovimonas sediminis TaxID=2056283 RepID=UPI000C806FCC|nr:PAS domain-containing protein [Acidimangrovimonas sediminis]